MQVSFVNEAPDSDIELTNKPMQFGNKQCYYQKLQTGQKICEKMI
jgi:hypothetical protein